MNVVGIGASAGGLKALLEFFKSTPEKPNCAFVVIQHLSPDFKSMMRELLSGTTKLPIEYVNENVSIELNKIYLIPPKYFITISDGIFHLEDRSIKETQHIPIDLFFSSLAKNFKEKAIAIILSGSGSDGTRGAKGIYQNGGLVIAQDESAEFNSMPKSVADSGYFHRCLSPEKIFPVIKEYIDTGVIPEHLPEKSERDVLDVLKAHTSIDYSHYKSSTLDRRILRQMNSRDINSIDEYGELLLKNTEAIDELNEDILIGVTEFFRDIEEFNYLKKNIAEKVLTPDSSECRIWLAGISTGEEVYSVAIVVNEVKEEIGYKGKICIFATDVNKKAIEIASDGEYPEDKFSVMDPYYVKKYFDKSGKGYKVKPFLRKDIIFAQQNILQDPPFTKLDLISCRNMLIYLKVSAQEKILNMFHFCLKDNGILFLGKSEGLGHLDKKYHTIEKNHKFYEKVGQSQIPYRVSNEPYSRKGLQRDPKNNQISIPKELLTAYDRILECEVGDGLLINSNSEVVHYFGRINEYMSGINGRKENNFINSFEGDLKIAISTSYSKSCKNKETVKSKGITYCRRDKETYIDVSVNPVSVGSNNYLYHISLSEKEDIQETSEKVFTTNYQPDKELHHRISELESELKSTRENLQITVEELQTSNEELQATVEEMSVANEELQSTNEELHSVNEELYTVNAELEAKNTELLQLNQDMENLLISLDVGILFVDKNLNIRKFNPSIATIFNLIDNDIGRPINHIAYHLDDPKSLNDQLIKVINTDQSVSEEIKGIDGAELLKKIYPYKTSQGAIEGAILTFTRISEIKELNNRLNLAMKTANLVWWDWDIARDEFTMHPTDWCILGYNPSQMTISSNTWHRMTHPDDIARVKTSLDKSLNSQSGYWEFEHRFKNQLGNWSWVLNTGTVTHWSSDRKPLRMIGATQKIDKRKMNELRLASLLKEARASILAKSNFLSVISHEMKTPLNPILGLLDILDDVEDIKEIHNYTEIIREAAVNLDSLITDILDYSTISSGHVEFLQSECSLNDLLTNVYSEFEHRFTLKGIDLKLDLPQKQVFTLCDHAYLKKAIVKLVENSLKFTDSGECHLELISENNKALITIMDTGVGIEPNKLDVIFEKFNQSNMSNTRPHKGLGLGLSIAKLLVEGMEGGIEVSSDVASTKFYITLPLSKLDNEEVHKESKIEKLKRVLVIEDDDYNLVVLKGYLAPISYEIVTAKDIFEGIKHYSQSLFDLVILDFLMPDGDAIDFLSKVDDSLSHFIVFTENRFSLDQSLINQFNVSKVLDKPASKRKFMDCIAEIMKEVNKGFKS